MESKQYYSYALDKNQRLVNVKEAAKGEEYLCPHCGGVMIPRQGTKRRWHFAHKGDTGVCSDESYLHKLAKKRIRECFLSAEHFYIWVPSKGVCSVSECPVGKLERCSFPKRFDLKEEYNCCEEEEVVGRYRADLILRHDKNDCVPILIEIQVSHKCTERKIKSGYEIIEVRIDTEEDIDRIVNTVTIGGDSHLGLPNNDDAKSIFYNFNQLAFSQEIPPENCQRQKFRFWIDSRGNVHFDCNEGDSVRCLTPNTPEIEEALFLIQSDSPIESDFAFWALSHYRLGLKYCEMCEAFRSNGINLCNEKVRRMFEESKGNKHISNLSDAMECSGFKQVNYQDTKRIFYINYTQKCRITYRTNSMFPK